MVLAKYLAWFLKGTEHSVKWWFSIRMRVVQSRGL